DRFAGEGFVALAPDLYHGQTTTEPDEAAKMMMALNLDKASKDLGGAITELQTRTGRSSVGVVGFCMGGGLAYKVACDRPDAVKAVAPFYGVIPWPAAAPDYGRLEASVQGHYAADDGSAPPDVVADLELQLRALGKDCMMFVYPDTDHAFFNDTRPEVYDAQAATLAFNRTVAHFRSHLS
ncbi:MAG: Carboxymethylenebutenolidase, partial [Acidimicrobiia bacterium]|nr:Carboxymethylenebutenolidase [Acidimicrobiia bacterium]